MSDSENPTKNEIYDFSDSDSDIEGDDEDITISVFLIYLIESIITGSLIFFVIFKNYDEIILFDDFKKNIIILSVSFIFFNLFNLIVTNTCIKFEVNYSFNFILFIIIALYKLSFVSLALNFFYTRKIPFEVSFYAFLFWKAGTSLYYLILILIKLCISNFHMSIFFVIGFLASGASFGFQYLYSKDFINAETSGALALIEVIFLSLSFIYGLKKGKFRNKRFFEKVILTDSYKYYLVLICIISVPIVLIMCLILICKSCCNSGICDGNTFYYSSSENVTNGEKPIKQSQKKEGEKKVRDPYPFFIIDGFAYDRNGNLFNFN